MKKTNRNKKCFAVFSSLVLGINSLLYTIHAEEETDPEETIQEEQAETDEENSSEENGYDSVNVEKEGSGEVILDEMDNPMTGAVKMIARAEPDEGWYTRSLEVFNADGNNIVYETGDNWISFIQDGPATVKAVFDETIPSYDLTFVNIPHVAIKAEVNGAESTRAREGDAVVITAEAEPGFSVKEFYAVCSYDKGTEGPARIPFLNNPASFTMPACNMEIHASLETARHDIRVINHDLASGIAEAGGKQVHSGKCGEMITVRLSYDAKYFRSDGISVEASDGTVVETEKVDPYTYTFVMPEDDVQIRVRETAVTVKDENGDTYVIDSYRALPSDLVNLTSGWWVADTDITLDRRVCVGEWGSTIPHNVNLFLKDGVTVTFAKGIQTDSGRNMFYTSFSTLSIWGGEKGDGHLIAYGTILFDAIGSEDALPYMDGGKVSIHGGIITAEGREGRYGIGGTGSSINIYGGTVEAVGGETGAGISAHYGTVNIHGGTVNAQGGKRIMPVSAQDTEEV